MHAKRGAAVGRIGANHVTCPVCGYAFRTTQQGTYVTVGREADLCPKIPGRPSDGARLIRAGITMCPACSFAADEDFSDLLLSFDERYAVEERLREDGLLRVFRSASPPWLAFHAAETCGKARGATSRALGDLCLRASWVCRKEREHPFESTFQLRALRHFIRSLQDEDLVGRELSVTTYLVGELNRRLGNHREALNWYVNAGRTTEGDPRVAWLDRLIDRQSKLAREHAA
jgi:uncharacterized protein